VIARRIVAVVVGLASWLVVATLLGRVLVMTWTAYAARAEAYDFSVAMLLTRLGIGVVATMAAGWVTSWWSSRDSISLWALAVVLVIVFVPVHYQLWSRFPVGYHVAFLGSLVPLTHLGGVLMRSRASVKVSQGPAS
jgi:hypothetical protein